MDIPGISLRPLFLSNRKTTVHSSNGNNRSSVSVDMLMCTKTQRKLPQKNKITVTMSTHPHPHLFAPILILSQPVHAAESPNSILDMFRMTVPDQTVEEAESGIREHAMSLVQVKPLLESESWKDAQKELRKSSSYLKQDIYTIIQGKPGPERAQLRILYSKLFNDVT